jgi:transporter family-2 protein
VQNVYLLLATFVGAGLAIQAGVNTQLRVATGSALWAALLSASLTVVLLAAAQVVQRDPLDTAAVIRFPWWIWTGGVMGACYMFGVVFLTRPLGVALMFGAAIMGQVLTGLVVDHFGWFGVPVHPISPLRLVGALLLIAGAALIRFV